ncbi:MAG: hypothetical protein Q8P67_28310 [archaeon]|nr:hypothetical protein [archaeon]
MDNPVQDSHSEKDKAKLCTPAFRLARELMREHSVPSVEMSFHRTRPSASGSSSSTEEGVNPLSFGVAPSPPSVSVFDLPASAPLPQLAGGKKMEARHLYQASHFEWELGEEDATKPDSSYLETFDDSSSAYLTTTDFQESRRPRAVSDLNPDDFLQSLASTSPPCQGRECYDNFYSKSKTGIENPPSTDGIDSLDTISSAYLDDTAPVKPPLTLLSLMGSPVPAETVDSASMIWNNQYRAALSMEDTLERHTKLTTITNDFTYAALSFAKIIIAELPLPYPEKTIKPLDYGGVAGGLKYSVDGILFKIAKDTLISAEPPLWMYGGPDGPDDEAAIKAAHGELNGAESFIMSYTKGLNIPLISLITYRGFTIVAISLIPVDKSTLKYGCADGGRTIHAEDPSLNEIMITAGERMNLKHHLVGKSDVSIIGPGDIEGHLGHDGLFYVLDFGRVMPPEAPPKGPLSPKGHRQVFSKFLRREFVSQIYRGRKKTALCSDAYTSWDSQVDSEASRVNAAEVRQATEYLYTMVVPEHAQMLDEMAGSFTSMGEKLFQSFHSMSTIMERFSAGYVLHSGGLNCRHMGRVYQHLKEPLLRKLYISSIVARTIKRRIESQMRDMMATISYPSASFANLIVDYLNSTLFTEDEEFWASSLPQHVQELFPTTFSSSELAELLANTKPLALRHTIDVRLVVCQLSVLMNFLLTSSFKRDLLSDSLQLSLDIRDIKRFDAKIRNSYIIEMSFADRDLKQVDVDAPPHTHIRLMSYARKALVRLKTKLPFCPVLSEKLGFAYSREAFLYRDQGQLLKAKSRLLKSALHYETSINHFMYQIGGYLGIFERYFLALMALQSILISLGSDSKAEITRQMALEIQTKFDPTHKELSDVDIAKMLSASRLPTHKEVQSWIAKAMNFEGATCGDLIAHSALNQDPRNIK